MNGRFLGLPGIGNQASQHTDHKVDRTAMAGMLDLRDVLQLVVDGLNDETFAQQQVYPSAAADGSSCWL